MGFLVVNGYSTQLNVKHGKLILKHGLTGEAKETLLEKAAKDIDHLVIAGNGTVSIEAIKWLMTQNIMVTMLDEYGNLVVDMLPKQNVSGIVKRRQATASREYNLKIAVWLLREKLAGQRNNLAYLQTLPFCDDRKLEQLTAGRALIDNRYKILPSCDTIESLLVVEAQAAAAYWECFESLPIAFQRSAKLPVAWLSISGRASTLSQNAKYAVNPFHACLNYCYAVLETRVRRECLLHNIDSDFGILHADHATRKSLVFDLLEPLRPEMDRRVFNFFVSSVFKPTDFFQSREGICKISHNVIHQIVPLAGSLDGKLVETVKRFANYFKKQWPDAQDAVKQERRLAVAGGQRPGAGETVKETGQAAVPAGRQEEPVCRAGHDTGRRERGSMETGNSPRCCCRSYLSLIDACQWHSSLPGVDGTGSRDS